MNRLETFDEFLTSSFAHGVFSRELRLSLEEVRVVLKKYPKASMKCLSPEASDKKCWYEINLMPPITIANDMEFENSRLKKEIGTLKESVVHVK